MNIKSAIIGTIVTIVIGGTAYTVSQGDIIKNFANDTGLTQEQAEQYIKNIPEEELASWDEVGSLTIEEGQGMIEIANGIDCVNYEYEWESFTMSCSEGKAQINKFGKTEVLLGQSYIKLSLDSASMNDIRETIRLIDELNSYLQFEIVRVSLDQSAIDEIRKNNSYNKAILKTVLESN